MEPLPNKVKMAQNDRSPLCSSPNIECSKLVPPVNAAMLDSTATAQNFRLTAILA
jgi:hypothetical protein